MHHSSNLPESLPKAEQVYIQKTVRILESEVGDNLLGVYLFGSASYDEYVPGTSDLDIQVVVKEQMGAETIRQLATMLIHRVHYCPATKLEFVVYAVASLQSEETIAYCLNLNTGSTFKADHISIDPTEDDPHWFILDIAMGKRHAVSLFGPDASDIFPTISQQKIAQAMLECLTWFHENLYLSEAHKLCVLRCLAFAEEGELLSKKAAKARLEERQAFKDYWRDSAMIVLQKSTMSRLQEMVDQLENCLQS